MKHEILANGIEIYQGDCLEVMTGFENKKYDFVFTDPPYNVGRNYDNHDDQMPENEYMSWVGDWIKQIKRTGNSFAIYPPKIRLREFWNLMPNQHLLICSWSPMGAPRGKFIHQYIPLLVPKEPVKMIQDHWWNAQVPEMGYFYTETKYAHPAQTSLDITERIIEAFTMPGQSVLDPFGGTGTTAEACIRLGRRCTIIEKSPNYLDIAKQRIKNVFLQPALDMPVADGVQQLATEAVIANENSH